MTLRTIISGATGLIGGHLLRELRADGWAVAAFTRDVERAKVKLGDVEAFQWDPMREPAPADALRGRDVVFHLAGESIASGRWTKDVKHRARASRVDGVANLAKTITAMDASERPRVVVCASAVGYYGDAADRELDESSPVGVGFLAELCRDWEAAADPMRDALRVVHARIGVVLAREGGALPKMLPPFKLGIGGVLGSGRHFIPWLHIGDIVGMLKHAATSDTARGPINLVAPDIVTNRTFTKTLGRVIKRPTIFPVPAFVLRLMFGEMATVILASQRVIPKAAQDQGYTYRFPTLEGALRDLTGKPVSKD